MFAWLRRMIWPGVAAAPKPATPSAPEGWPAYPNADAGGELAKILYAAEIEVAKEDRGRDFKLVTQNWTTEGELFKDLQERLREIAVGRAGQRMAIAEMVQKASAAIVTLYTGLLGLVFAANGSQLPVRALVPAIFLGAAVALSTAYVAFVTPPGTEHFVPPQSLARSGAWQQTIGLITWVNTGIQRRRWLIQAAVLSLAAGLAFLPAPFVTAAAGSGPPAAPTTAWPSVPVAASAAQAALQGILFQAQVDETRASRAAEAKPDAPSQASSDAITWVAALITSGAIVVFLVALWLYEAAISPRIARKRAARHAALASAGAGGPAAPRSL